MAEPEGELTKTPGYPVSKRMSAKFEGTFAFVTLKDRMPRVLTQVIDTVHKEETGMKEKHGKAGTEDIKAVLSKLSQLRYELQTNKAMVPIQHGEDVKEWSDVFKTYRENLKGEEPQWFTVSWLFAECYMYRRIAEIFETSALMKDFDPFGAQKHGTFNSSERQITALAKYIHGVLSNPALINQSLPLMRTEFEHLLLLCLWGNKVDLSMMSTVENYDGGMDQFDFAGSPGEHTQLLRTNILADHTAALWELLEIMRRPKSESIPRRIDFVLDNAGFEIVSDLCLSEWLLTAGLVDKVHFHCKKIPWFVSDALIKDFNWTLDALAGSKEEVVSDLGKKFKSRLVDGSFVVSDHSFWTTSYEYAAMKNVAPDLYDHLSKSYLVFFKGDLNYRKLLADRNWLYTEDFSIALGGFQPTNVCALRTLKADLVTGLPPGVAEKAAKENKDWMITGQYAVLQVHNSTK